MRAQLERVTTRALSILITRTVVLGMLSVLILTEALALPPEPMI